MLSARNIENYAINFDKDVRYINKEDYIREKQRTNIEKGDVLLTIVGTIGRVSIVEQTQKFTIQRSVALLKPILISSRYLMYYLSSSPFSNKILIDNSKGSAQKGIYLSTLKSINIPITNLKEQNVITQGYNSHSLCPPTSLGHSSSPMIDISRSIYHQINGSSLFSL